jgi:hypothetical protein
MIAGYYAETPTPTFKQDDETTWTLAGVKQYIHKYGSGHAGSCKIFYGWDDDDYHKAMRIARRHHQEAGFIDADRLSRSNEAKEQRIKIMMLIHDEDPGLFKPGWQKRREPRPVWYHKSLHIGGMPGKAASEYADFPFEVVICALAKKRARQGMVRTKQTGSEQGSAISPACSRSVESQASAA